MRDARPPWVRIDAGDDAAVLDDGAVLTVDTLVEGVHWDDRLSPSDVGYKAVAVSASDLGAMGARPAWMLLSLSLPSDRDDRGWVGAFAEGLGEACRDFGVYLLGGDITGSGRGGPRVVSGTLGGRLVGAPALRGGGRADDEVWVTGTPGLAGAGYALASPPPEALAALRRPRPPVDFAVALAASGLATAAMDLSDGLASDLPRLCRASGVGAEVIPERLPLHPCLAGIDDPLPLQVGAGDDYELLFSAPADRRAEIEALAGGHGVSAQVVGRLGSGGGVRLRGRAWPRPWSHFEGDP